MAVLALACSNGAVERTPYDAGGPRCPVVVEQHPDEGASHIPCTSPATYLTEPPSSGNHYPTWPDYKVYDQPIRWGHLVHAMEHGGVVIV